MRKITPSYRPAEDADADAISALVQRTLLPHTLPGWTSAAVERLYGENSPGALREHLKVAAFGHVCLNSNSVVGFITSKKSRLISLVAIDPSFQRQGIGSQLIRHLLAHVSEVAPEISVVEVNATEYSLPFYRERGFYPISEFIEFEGCRFIRLGYWRKNPLLQSHEC